MCELKSIRAREGFRNVPLGKYGFVHADTQLGNSRDPPLQTCALFNE